MRDSVVFYKSFRDAIRDIPVKYQLKAYNVIFDYAFEGKEPNDLDTASAILKLVKPQIDANEKRYENGKRGGRPKTKPKPKDNQTETKPEPNVNDNDNVNDNVNDNPPTPLQGYFPDKELNEAFNLYVDRCRNGDVEFQSTQRLLYDLAHGDREKMIAILNQSVAQGWKGLHPLKSEKSEKIHFENERTYDFNALEKKIKDKQKRRAEGG